jgi:DnaJ-class molecular chaperone
MSKNYYEILEINRSCSQEDISNAYRRLSLKYHPKRNDTKDFATNNISFHEIAEAYEVLGDGNKYINLYLILNI